MTDIPRTNDGPDVASDEDDAILLGSHVDHDVPTSGEPVGPLPPSLIEGGVNTGPSSVDHERNGFFGGRGQDGLGDRTGPGPEEYGRQRAPKAQYRFGPLVQENGVTFRLWATSESVELVFPGRENLLMEAGRNAMFSLFVEGVRPGQLYMFAADGLTFPDPASRAQADDADGWSVVCADPGRRPLPAALRPWHEAVIVELHVGTATPSGTFRELADHLPHFADAGYTTIELMPIGEFPGERNWGYDGVLPYAPDASYGSPEDFRALVDRAHELGLAVMLDVVYNHFGPIDNYIHHYSKAFFAEGEQTPWGAAINFAEPMVRAYFTENVRMWLEDYDLDGLRFDAVHEFRTDTASLFMSELATQARLIKPDAMLVVENMYNRASWLERGPAGKPYNFNAQWNDDIHHVLRVLLAGDDKGYFKQFAKAPLDYIETALAEGFVRQGIDPDGRPIGEPSAHLPPDAFVSFVQNHDQIGNQPEGRRLADQLDAERLDFMHFVVMLSPQIPMFFMGEEAHIRSRFPFFGDLKGELVEEIREGRAEQAAQFFEHDDPDIEVPDPSSPETVAMAKIDWAEFELPERLRSLERFKGLVAIRRQHLWPISRSEYLGATSANSGPAISVTWRYEVGTLTMVLNPSMEQATFAAPLADPIASTGTVERSRAVMQLGPWSAALWVER